MLNQKQLAVALEREQTELFSEVQCKFWEALFRDLLRKHSFENDFFLTSSNLTRKDVVTHLGRCISELSQKYELTFTKSAHPTCTEFKLRFSHYGYKEKNFGELSVIVRITDITMRILPYSPLVRQFWLEEYVLVENILKDLCDEVYDAQKQKFNALLEECRRIESLTEGVTMKTVEIAQNSIRALYEASDQENKSLIQKNLYSTMVINERTVRIYHKDFLDAPKVLMKELERF